MYSSTHTYVCIIYLRTQAKVSYNILRSDRGIECLMHVG